MLKVRIMPTLLYKDVGLVKGIGFDSSRRVGTPMQAVKVYNMRGVDELVFLDITATADRRQPDCDLIDDLADECFMPLTVGGGVRSVEDVGRLLTVGADKVSINTAALEVAGLVADSAAHFGSQCIVVSIDARREPDGSHQVYIHAGQVATGRAPVEVALEAQTAGAGEILLTSIDRDGSMRGYDTELIRSVTDAVSVPVVASGGAGEYKHLAEALGDGGASAVAAASIFHFTEQTPAEAKAYLSGCGYPVRR